MEAKKITVGSTDYAVVAEKISDLPLAYKVRATHPTSGVFHEHSITFGEVDCTTVPTLEILQSGLDQSTVTSCQLRG